MGLVTLSPAHMIPGIELSPDDVFREIIFLWHC